MNQHYVSATISLDNAYVAGDGGAYDLAKANVQATLAVAYAQDTATLVAVFADGAAGPMAGVDYAALAETIKDRLGIGTPKP